MARLVWLLVLCVSTSCEELPQGAKDLNAANSESAAAQDQPMPVQRSVVRDQVASFLSTWLIERNSEKALSFLSSEAIRGPIVLSSSCAGYIPSRERHNPHSVRKGVLSFLDEGKAAVSAQTMSGVLSTELLEGMDEDLIRKAVNDVNSDAFLLLKISQASDLEELVFIVENLHAGRMLLQQLESGDLYVGIAAVKTPDAVVPFYLVWKQEASGWKIIHLDLICS